MRFLFINQYYAPDYAATAQQLTDICEHLVSCGHEVHVVASQSLYDGRDFRLPSHEVINGVQVHRVKLARGSRKRLRDRLVDYLSFYRKAFVKVNVLPKADVVVTLTTPPMISLLGTWLRVFRRTRFVYWVMDIYPDIALEAGVLRRFGFTASAWSLLGRFSYMTANRVVVLGEDMKRVLKGKGVPENRLAVLPSWSCARDISPVDPDENGFRREHVSSDRFTLMYSGNMGTCHCFEAVIEAAKVLDAEGDAIDFLFVGSGKREAALREKLNGLRNVRFMPYQDRSQLSESLGAADAHLITLYPQFDGLMVPSKLYGIMAAAKPVVFVGGRDNQVADVTREGSCGVRIDPDDPEKLVAVLRSMAREPEQTRQLGENGRRYFLNRFDRADACEQFRDMLEREAVRPGFRGARPLAPVGIRPCRADSETSS